jgi:hypothetical protein
VTASSCSAVKSVLGVCTENLDSDVLVVQPTDQRTKAVATKFRARRIRAIITRETNLSPVQCGRRFGGHR